MGYRLAQTVADRWGHLPGNAFKVLNRLAWTAQDDAAAPTYWAGPGPLAAALGRAYPDGDDEPAAKARSAAEFAIRQAVADLRKAGALAPDHRGGHRRRAAEYVLTLGERQRETLAKSAGKAEGNPRERQRETLGKAQGNPLPEEGKRINEEGGATATAPTSESRQAPSAKSKPKSTPTPETPAAAADPTHGGHHAPGNPEHKPCNRCGADARVAKAAAADRSRPAGEGRRLDCPEHPGHPAGRCRKCAQVAAPPPANLRDALRGRKATNARETTAQPLSEAERLDAARAAADLAAMTEAANRSTRDRSTRAKAAAAARVRADLDLAEPVAALITERGATLAGRPGLDPTDLAAREAVAAAYADGLDRGRRAAALALAGEPA